MLFLEIVKSQSVRTGRFRNDELFAVNVNDCNGPEIRLNLKFSHI